MVLVVASTEMQSTHGFGINIVGPFDNKDFQVLVLKRIREFKVIFLISSLHLKLQ